MSDKSKLSLIVSISAKELKCVVLLPPFLSFSIFWTKLKSPPITTFSHSKVESFSNAF